MTYVHRSAIKGWELGTRRPLLENIETLYAGMGYVLVPVPTQLRDEVKTLIQQRLTDNSGADTLASFGEGESELRTTSQAEDQEAATETPTNSCVRAEQKRKD